MAPQRSKTPTTTLNGAQVAQPPEASTPPGTGTQPSPPLPTLTPAPKLRSRPRLAAAGIALVAVGGLVGAYLLTSSTTAVDVVAVSTTVQRGQIITKSNLTTAAVTLSPALRTVPADQLSSLVGKRAASDLTAGSLLAPAGVTTALTPAAGRTVVGVAVTGAQLPSQPLNAGDTIRVIDTPKASDDPPAATPSAVKATVVSTTVNPALQRTIVDVTVPTDQAASLAARVATGRVAIVLDSAER